MQCYQDMSNCKMKYSFCFSLYCYSLCLLCCHITECQAGTQESLSGGGAGEGVALNVSEITKTSLTNRSQVRTWIGRGA